MNNNDTYLNSSMIIYKINVFLMAICNLFKKLSNNTGEFLMFSQYAEDLTKNNSQGYKYRVVPSRFIAANVDFSKFKYATTGNLNVDFPTYLQNYFENGCAVCKNMEDVEWNPTISSNLFWNAMIEGGLINVKSTGKSDVKNYVNEFKYINDINIQSYDEVNGMGYSEMYCYIPNEAKEYMYGCSDLRESNSITTVSEFVEGYSEDDNNNLLSLNITPDHKYFIDKRLDFYFDNKEVGIKSVSSDKYEVNCIIILYNINSCDEDGNNVAIYENIPLGIYLPGVFDEGTSDMTNIITKHVNNSDIFNSGTSYGIRVCSRFSIIPNIDFIKSVDVSSVSSDEYSSLCQVMGGISDNLNEMMSVVKSSMHESETLKNTLDIFKKSRTNVPYPIDINGTKYWYVNGRNTGITIPDGTKYTNYSESDIINSITIWDGIDTVLTITVYTCDPNTGELSYIEKLRPTGPQDATSIAIRWNLVNKYTLESILADKLYLYYPDGTRVDLSEFIPAGIFNIDNVTEDGVYKIQAIVDMEINGDTVENVIEGALDFKFCLPIFFGLVESSIGSNGKDSANDIIDNMLKGEQEIQYIPGIQKYILPSQYNKIKFETNGGKIVYAYPASYAKLERILNLNSMDDCMDDFVINKEPKTIQVKFLTSNESIEYYLYYTKDSTGNNISTEFDFTTKERQIDNSFEFKYNDNEINN